MVDPKQLRAEEMLSDYRLTPATLMARLDPAYIASKWVLYLSWKIAQCVARGGCGLLISAPPRHGKSRLATIATPLWILETFPQYMTGVITYGEDLSTDFSREIRDYIQQYPNLLSVRLRQDVTRVANFLTTAGGGLKAVGLRGTITGRGFNVLVVDDYIKEPKEAQSANYLEGLWTWYQTVARTRLEPGAVIIIVATRWVKNDLHGKLMKLQELTGRNYFEYVTMPALAYAPPSSNIPQSQWPLGYPDPIGRAPGEPLFPERYTKEDLENIRAEVENRWFEAMFQQNPHGEEGSVVPVANIKKWSLEEYAVLRAQIRSVPHNFIVGRYWDMASTKDAGDYSVGSRGILIKQTSEFVVDDVSRGQWSPAKAEGMFQGTMVRDKREFGDTLLAGMEQEPGSSGKYSVRHFQGLLNQESLGLVLRESPAVQSKALNASTYIAAIENHKVGMVEGHWNQNWLDEQETFPEGTHDDQVDATSGAYRLVKGQIGASPVWGRGKDVEDLRRSMQNKALVDAQGNPIGSSVTWGSQGY